MEINNYAVAAISLFLVLIYSVILINSYENAMDTIKPNRKIKLSEEEFFRLIDVNITVPDEPPAAEPSMILFLKKASKEKIS